MQNERLIFEIGPNAALGADNLQWILYKATGKQKRYWRGVSFVRSTKEVLLRCIREKGLEVSAEGAEKLLGLPYCFDEWLLGCQGPEHSENAPQWPKNGLIANSAESLGLAAV